MYARNFRTYCMYCCCQDEVCIEETVKKLEMLRRQKIWWYLQSSAGPPGLYKI